MIMCSKIPNVTIGILVLLIITPSAGAQEQDDDLNLSEKILPVTDSNVFRDHNYYNWGCSIIKSEDGEYHLFYSRWPREYSFYSWLTYSEIAHAVSEKSEGPFKIESKAVIDYMDTEDVSMWYDPKQDRFYAVFHAHNYIGMITSNDGYNWKSAKYAEISPKSISFADGRILKPDRMERPFIYIEKNNPIVLAIAVKKGNDSYTIFVPFKE